jgi:type I restriction enzyme R subunit
MATPELKARQKIDELLIQAGWDIQGRENFNRKAKLGVAVREFLMSDNTEADYLLFVDGKAVGAIEAKKAGLSLSGVEGQSQGYACNLPDGVRAYQLPLPFIYESNGEEIYFRDCRNEVCPSRKVFAFHKPETLLEWINQDYTLRNNLNILPELNKDGLRDCQTEAIMGLETSLAKGKEKSLIQMATGAGKTFTACNFTYRLLKHAKAKRILFLVDRNNLGDQTKKEFEQFKPKDDNRSFSDIYITQHLQHNQVDKDAKIVITTIQRLYSMLRGEEDYDKTNEEVSAYEIGSLGRPKEVVYNAKLPIEYFDFIVVDECHRSIYGDWRQVLDYFDAFIIGLTATPSTHTLGYFNRNLVSEYPYERSVLDNVNVGYEIFRIKTEIGENGGMLEAGFTVPVRDKKTRKTIYEQLDEDVVYEKKDLDRSVLSKNQIRTVLECYKESIFTQLFPEREKTWIPKTLIFAKDDNHAEEIVRIARDVFNKGNDFCKKITYNVSGDKPKDLIAEFRTSPKLRMAVTVDMIATGTDIKPLEVVIFMRDVRSELYYEQMKGRGVRSINNTDLKQVTPNADVKNRFYLIDAVGVTESKKSASQPLERKKSISFKKLLEQVAQGKIDDDTLSSVAGRISAIEAISDDKDNARIKELTGGRSLSCIANGILDTIDFDIIEGKSEKEIENLKDKAVDPFNNPVFRTILLEMSTKSRLVIDEFTVDRVITSDFSLKRAGEITHSFKDFIETNKNEIDALSIIYNAQYKERHLTYEKIRDLSQKMQMVHPPLSTVELWRAYEFIEKDRVKKVKDPAKLLTNLVQLVRFAIGADETLDDFGTVANQRFNLWMGRQFKKGINYSEDQKEWLELIKNYIIANVYIDSNDIQAAMADKGGIFKAKQVFGHELEAVLEDLSLALVG